MGQEGGGGGLQHGRVALVRLERELRPHPQAAVRPRVGDDLHLKRNLAFLEVILHQSSMGTAQLRKTQSKRRGVGVGPERGSKTTCIHLKNLRS